MLDFEKMRFPIDAILVRSWVPHLQILSPGEVMTGCGVNFDQSPDRITILCESISFRELRIDLVLPIQNRHLKD